MPTPIRAAVLSDVGEPFVMSDLMLDDPRPDEVLVRIVAVGLCHTDLAVQHGHMPTAFPAVLGHEGAGIVEQVGTAVTGFDKGDPVALSFASCGECTRCLDGRRAHCLDTPALNLGGHREDGSTTLATLDGDTVHGNFFGQSSFATHVLVAAKNVVSLGDHAPLEICGPLGCGVQTGVGTVLNTLDVPAGSSVVVTGAGAVGLSAVMGAVVAGATTIVAVDVVPDRLELARELGATHTINPDDTDACDAPVDVAREVRRITGGGAEYAVDTTGSAAVIISLTKATLFGASIALVGVPQPGSTVPLGLVSASGRTFIGGIEGEAVPQTFIPRMLALHAAGRLPFDRLVRTYPFSDLSRAIDDTAAGRTVKAVLLL